MVQDATTFRPWTIREIAHRFPASLFGSEGEGDGGNGTGTQTPPPSGDGTDSQTTPPDPNGESTTEPKTYDEAYVKTLRDENAARRIREKELADKLAEFESAENERKKAEMSEAERAKAEAEEHRVARESAEKALIDERKRNAIISEASKLNFRDPEDALVYVSLDEISMTEAGTPHKTSVESAVKKIADSKKYLIDGPGSADGGSRGTNPATESERLKAAQDDIAARGGVPIPV